MRKQLRITRVVSGSATEQYDSVATEQSLSIVVNHQEFSTLYCTPEHLEELVLGFLWSAGLLGPSDLTGNASLPSITIDEAAGVASLSVDKMPQVDPHKRVVLTGCCQGISRASLEQHAMGISRRVEEVGWSPESILRASASLSQHNSLFRETGATHAAGLWRDGGLIVVREDIGRHNAVDKIGGYLLKSQTPASGNLLAVTGRVSSDLVLKAAQFGLSTVASRGGPTSLAVDYARSLDITLCGFCRGDRFNLYSSPERILTSSSQTEPY